jgi:hypothetical protein
MAIIPYFRLAGKSKRWPRSVSRDQLTEEIELQNEEYREDSHGDDSHHAFAHIRFFND